MKRSLAIAIVFILVQGGICAPPELKLTPDKIKPSVGNLVKVSADTTAKTIKWKVIGDWETVQDSSGKFIFVVAKEGKVSVLAIAITETGDSSEFVECIVSVEKVDPIVNPLTKNLLDVLPQVLPAEKALIPNLKSFYTKASTLAQDTTLTTWGDLTTKLSELAVSEGISQKLKPLQLVIAQLLSSELPSKNASTLPLDKEGRDKATNLFNKIAAALADVR